MRKDKKQLLSLLVMAVMVVVLVATAGAVEVKAAEQCQLFLDENGYGLCPACGEVKWTKFNGVTAYTGITDHQHFYLFDDVTYDGATAGSTMLQMVSGGKVCFHLNGNTLTVRDAQIDLSAKDESNLFNLFGANGRIYYRYNKYGGFIRQGYGTANIYGGTHTPLENNMGAFLWSTRTSTLQDATVNGRVDAVSSNGNRFILRGATTIENMDFTGGGKLELASDWTGSAMLTVPAAYWTDNQLDAVRFTYSGDAPAGKLKLSTGETLRYKDGAIQTSRLVLDENGQGECPACNQTVLWNVFDGKKPISSNDAPTKEHVHYYLADDASFSGSMSSNIAVLSTNGKLCFHLNGKTLTVNGARFWLGGNASTDSAINIIGTDGTIIYSKSSIVQQNRGVVNIYGGTYTTTDGTAFVNTATRRFTLVDATLNGNLMAKSTGTVFSLQGSTTVNKVVLDYLEDGVAKHGKLELTPDWTGSAILDKQAEELTGGKVSAEWASYIGAAPAGKMKLASGEFLGYSGGQLVLPELELDAEGNGECIACGKTVQWKKFDGSFAVGSAATPITNKHLHYYLESDVTYSGDKLDSNLAYLGANSGLCLNLNGYVLIVNGACLRTVDDGAALNIIGGNGRLYYRQNSIIQQDKGTVKVYGGAYYSTGGKIPFAANAKDITLTDAAVKAELISQSSAARFTLKGDTAVDKINLDAGGNLALHSGWTGVATLDMEVADLVGGKVPAAKVSYSGKAPAGTVKLASGKTLVYQGGMLAKQDDLVLDANGKGQCPVCNERVQWTVLNTDGMVFSNSGTPQHHHIYLADNVLSTRNVELIEAAANNKVCFHMNGYNLTTGSIIHAAGGEINIYGYGSNYTFTGSEAEGNVGLYSYGNGTLNLYGGTYNFPLVAGAESTPTLVSDQYMRIEDATINTLVTIDASAGVITLAGDTVIRDNIRFGGGTTQRGKVIVDKSFSGSATFAYRTGMVGYNKTFSTTRGTANGDFTGYLKLSDGRRLIHSSGKLKVSPVAKTLTWKDLDALPVANNSMTEAELRQLCLDFFHTTLSFAWTPRENAWYVNKEKQKDFYTDEVYGGTPYVTASTGTVYTAMEYYDPITGVLDVSGDCLNVLKTFANQCSGSAFWAWNRVCTSVTFSATTTQVMRHGCLRVGPYTYPDDLQQLELEGPYSTTGICEANGKQTMFESYAKLKPADGLVTHSPANGHTIMAASTPVVKRNSNGTIDGENSYIMYVDQDGLFNEDTQTDGTAYAHIGYDTKITFAQLFEEVYIPFTFAELNGQKVVDESVTAMSYAGKTITVEQLSAAKITSNYSISDITITVKDAGGNQVYRKLKAVNEFIATRPLHLSVDVSYAVVAQELAAYTDGTYTIEVSARIGTGEKPVVYSGKLCAGVAAKVSGSQTVWYSSAQEAIDDYTAPDFTAGNYIKTFISSDVKLNGGAYYIDAEGYDLRVTGAGKLYAMDSENKDFDGFGKWTVSEGVEIIRDFVAPDGTRYLVVTDAKGKTGAHKLVLELAGVSINTQKAGIYYNAQYLCDSTLAQMIEVYGIIASVNDMPGEKLSNSDQRTELHTFTPDDNHQVLSDSSTVSGIFKDSRSADDNARFGKLTVYANPYIQLDVDNDGKADVIVGDRENVGKKAGNAWSLYDILKNIDDNWAAYADQQAAVKAFYNVWKDKGMGQYGFTNIA